MIQQYRTDDQRRRDHKPNHTHKALNEKVVFRRNRDSSQVEVHIRIDNARNPHHNDRDQQDQ